MGPSAQRDGCLVLHWIVCEHQVYLEAGLAKRICDALLHAMQKHWKIPGLLDQAVAIFVNVASGGSVSKSVAREHIDAAVKALKVNEDKIENRLIRTLEDAETKLTLAKK